MENILVPTDFSENANNALDYAIQIAAQYGAAIHILHAFQTTSHAGHLANIDRIVKDDREKEMKACLEDKLNQLNSTVEITGRVRKGESVDLILDEAQKVGAEMIIMGTLGASNISKKVFGSTASNVIKSTNLPVLAVPATVSKADFSHLVVALDALKSPAPRVFNPMITFAKSFDLKINLVHVSSDEVHTDIDEKIKEYLSQNAVPFSYTKVLNEDIPKGIIDFTDTQGSCVLCLVSRQRNWFENLFHSSVSQKIAMSVEMPLLVLHDAKL